MSDMNINPDGFMSFPGPVEGALIRTSSSGARREFSASGVLEFHPVAPLVSVTTTDALLVTDDGGRSLLRLGRDGSFDGALEDMGEAARIFVERVRALLAGPGLQ